MEINEMEYWQSIMSTSENRWIEDSITRLNEGGALYYTGGESGKYMRLYPDGRLSAGTYEYAFPHIGEALFTPRFEQQYASKNEAFEAMCQLGGSKFLEDTFSSFPAIDTQEEQAMNDASFEMRM